MADQPPLELEEFRHKCYIRGLEVRNLPIMFTLSFLHFILSSFTS